MLAALLTILFSWDVAEWKIRNHPYVSSVYVWGSNHEDTGPKGTDAVIMVNVNPKADIENEHAQDWASEYEEDFYFKYSDEKSQDRAQKKACALAARWAAIYQRQATQWKARGKKVTPPWR